MFDAKSVPRTGGIAEIFEDSGVPLPKALLEERAERHEREHRGAERDRRRDALRTAALCLMWSIAGIGLLGTSFHLEDGGYARIAYFGGIAVGNGGIIFTLVAAYRRGEKRGDW